MTTEQFAHSVFQQHLDKGKLTASRCQCCGDLQLPPHSLCPNCYSEDLVWEELEGRGELVAFTAIHIAPTAMIAAGYSLLNPYVSGIVKLVDGPSISAQIIGVAATSPQEIQIGSAVHVAFIDRDGSQHKALAFQVGKQT